jgi:hypothetical protein
MTTETNKAIARRFMEEAWNSGNSAVADELISADYVAYEPGSPEPVRGPAGQGAHGPLAERLPGPALHRGDPGRRGRFGGHPLDQPWDAPRGADGHRPDRQEDNVVGDHGLALCR